MVVIPAAFTKLKPVISFASAGKISRRAFEIGVACLTHSDVSLTFIRPLSVRNQLCKSSSTTNEEIGVPATSELIPCEDNVPVDFLNHWVKSTSDLVSGTISKYFPSTISASSFLSRLVKRLWSLAIGNPQGR